ncbi:hypothetical protein F0562_010217 [Nyssa sinensis]|uniref:Bulb-type lectin domain-containing protein n=1 Tax=Nyssa sinensis TaxID=561372 RepID=A0A5J5A0W9_9ASTE|nr:hypothetical protein F0562_010217 [Nyssa sinensis]
MISNSLDTITTTQFIKDDGNTIVSSGENFELGFFSPGSSGNRYLGIWYKKISTGTVVWVANRKIPLTDTSGVLKVTNQGILTLVNRTNSIIWSSNTSRSTQDPIAQLLDSGNLVVRDANDVNQENFLWQSFDYPSDTMLPGMKLGKNLATGLDWYISSWKSNDDPSPDVTGGGSGCLLWFDDLIDIRQFPELGQDLYIRMASSELGEVGSIWEKGKSIIISSVVSTGTILLGLGVTLYVWKKKRQQKRKGRMVHHSKQVDTITAIQTIRDGDTIVSAAGNFELGFFSPGSSKNRYLGIWYKKIATGIVIWVANGDAPLKDTSGVLKFDSQGILVLLNSTDSIIWSSNSSQPAKNPLAQLLDTGNLVMSDRSDSSDPENFLWQSFDHPGNTFLPGMKFGKDLVIGLDKYLSSWRSADDPSPDTKSSSNEKRQVRIIIPILLVVVVLLSIFLFFYVSKKRKLKREEIVRLNTERDHCISERERDDLELPLFDFTTIATATNNFSLDNKLGEGGFGHVNKVVKLISLATKHLEK